MLVILHLLFRCPSSALLYLACLGSRPITQSSLPYGLQRVLLVGGTSMRAEDRKGGCLFSSPLSQLCWDLNSGCVHIQLQLLLGSSFLVPEIPGLQEHHPFPCPFRQRVVITFCCCKPLNASISFAGSLHLVHISANYPFTRVTSSQLHSSSYTLIDSVSE